MQEVQTGKKLTLKKETLKTLTEKELNQVAGGRPPVTFLDCNGACYDGN